jgi:hypothetical protein
MRQFKSCRDFGKFARSVKSRSRYVLEPDAQEFLETVIQTASSRIDTLTAGSILFRAQVGHHWQKQLRSESARRRLLRSSLPLRTKAHEAAEGFRSRGGRSGFLNLSTKRGRNKPSREARRQLDAATN